MTTVSSANIIPVRKMLNWLHRVFDKNPHPFLAFNFEYTPGYIYYADSGYWDASYSAFEYTPGYIGYADSGYWDASYSADPVTSSMTWSVSGGILTVVASNTTDSFSLDISGYTVSSIAAHINSISNYYVTYVDSSAYAALSAKVLIDGSAGGSSISNGGQVFGYTSLLWGILSSFASELSVLKQNIVNAVSQMNLQNATDYWAEQHGAYYGIPRNVGELDPDYAQRIISTVIMPRGNNVAMEAAIYAIIGSRVSVLDVIDYGDTAIYDGTYTFNGAILYVNTGIPPKYCLFDINYGYNLESGADLTAFNTQLVVLINQVRDAGCYLRNLNLQASELLDYSGLASTDSAQITIDYANLYNGTSLFDGSALYNGLSHSEVVILN